MLALVAGEAACTRYPVRTTHWYYFKTTDKGETAATSPLEPEELAKAMTDKEFVRLENAREFNGAGQWNKAKAPFQGVIYVRSQEIKSFEPLNGPPEDFNVRDAR